MTEDTSPVNIEKLIEEFKEGMYSLTAEAALQKLIKIGEPAVESLIKALNTEHKVSWYSMGEERSRHEDWIRQEAAMALGEIEDVRAVPHLIELLEYVPYMDGGDEGDWYWDVALAGVMALGQIGDARAVEPLLELTRDTKEPFIEAPSRWMIEELFGTEMDISGLGECIGVEVHREVARALGDIGLKNDDLEIIALGINELLNYEYIYDQGLEDVSYDELGIDYEAEVADVLGNICNSVKLRFAESTLGPSAAEALDMLTVVSKINRWTIPIDGRTHDAWEAVEGLAALEKIGIPEEVNYDSMTVPLLKEALKEQELPVSGKKAELIELLKIGPFIKTLGKRYSNQYVHRNAVITLGEIGEPAVEPLIKMLEDKHEDKLVCENVAEALRQITKDHIKSKEKDNIIKFLESDDSGTVMMGASMLKGILKE